MSRQVDSLTHTHTHTHTHTVTVSTLVNGHIKHNKMLHAQIIQISPQNKCALWLSTFYVVPPRCQEGSNSDEYHWSTVFSVANTHTHAHACAETQTHTHTHAQISTQTHTPLSLSPSLSLYNTHSHRHTPLSRTHIHTDTHVHSQKAYTRITHSQPQAKNMSTYILGTVTRFPTSLSIALIYSVNSLFFQSCFISLDPSPFTSLSPHTLTCTRWHKPVHAYTHTHTHTHTHRHIRSVYHSDCCWRVSSLHAPTHTHMLHAHTHTHTRTCTHTHTRTHTNMKKVTIIQQQMYVCARQTAVSCTFPFRTNTHTHTHTHTTEGHI